ncbi:MAG: prepilin-type N-terminal cleavage/methylation domain-containing protein [Myxococcota bacterium]
MDESPDTALRDRRARAGFTLVEIIIAVAILAILAGMLTPLVASYIDSARVSRARSETQMLASSINRLYSDTGFWPITNANGPSGRIDRVITSTNVATGAGPGAGPGAANWGTATPAKQIGDFLYWNNPDNDSSSTGGSQNQANQDYPTTGDNRWRGPYLKDYIQNDPWGRAYVINARFFPGGAYGGNRRHKIMVLSAGPDGRWQTRWRNNQTEPGPEGDDIGYVIAVD